MEIHHLDCGTLRPVDPTFGGTEFACHCLLLDLGNRLVLVDTGIGLQDIAHPAERLQEWFVKGIGPALDPSETAIEEVRRLGYVPEQVSDIVLTHLDRDHVGGLADFPWARVHAAPAARALMAAPRVGRDRDRVQSAQWSHGVVWAEGPIPAPRWKGFRSWTTPGLSDAEILLIDLPGHSTGHAGVAVPTTTGWFLHAGDAYYYRSQLIDPDQTPHGIKVFADATHQHSVEQSRTEHALASLANEPDVTLFAAHDAAEFHQLGTQGADDRHRHRSSHRY